MSNDYNHGKMGGRSPTYVEKILERVRAKNGKKYGLDPDEESEEIAEVDVEEVMKVDEQSAKELFIDHVQRYMRIIADDLENKSYAEYMTHYIEKLKEDPGINDSNEEEKRFLEQLKSKGGAYYGFIRRSDIEKMEAAAKAGGEENDRFVENLHKCFPEAFDDRAETDVNVDEEFDRKILFPTKDELVDNILKFGLLNLIDWYGDAVRRRFSMDDKTFRSIMLDNHLRKAIETMDTKSKEHKLHYSEWKVMCNQILQTRIYETVVNPGQNSGNWWYDNVQTMLIDDVDYVLCAPNTAGNYIVIKGLTGFVSKYINGWDKLFGYDSVKLNHKATHIIDTLERLLLEVARVCEFPSAIFEGIINCISYIKEYRGCRAEKFDILEVPLLLGAADFHYSQKPIAAECAAREDDCDHNEAI